MTCFCKLTVPALALGLPMDVLNSLGVLRSEQGILGSKTAVGQNTEDEITPGSGAVTVALEPTGLGLHCTSCATFVCKVTIVQKWKPRANTALSLDSNEATASAMKLLSCWQGGAVAGVKTNMEMTKNVLPKRRGGRWVRLLPPPHRGH